MDQTLSLNARRFAATISIVGLLTLATRVYLRMEMPESFIEAISYLSQFFTILTNTLIVLLFGAIALGWGVHHQFLKAIIIAISCVGLVYHAVLAHLLDLSGLALLADHGVHTIVPLLSVVWWLLYAPMSKDNLRAVVVWWFWPITYCGYILIRAAGSGFYPYPFLNLPETGIVGLSINIIVLMIVFAVVGFVLSLIQRVLRRQRSV